jgi:hypothetical protein
MTENGRDNLRMLTKNQLATTILKDFAINILNHDPKQYDITQITDDHAIDNADVGVAMEHLELIKSDAVKANVAKKDKALFNWNNRDYMGVRDLLELLPVHIRKCMDCNVDFGVSQKDVNHYNKNNYKLPMRCESCREANRAKWAAKAAEVAEVAKVVEVERVVEEVV